MLFNSLEYLLFLPIVVLLYFQTPPRWRWVTLLAASYAFYTLWKAEYLLIIVGITLITYVCGLKISKAGDPKTKRAYLALCLSGCLGALFLFKYAPFPGFVLPVGIAFYTFQAMGYAIDVYYGRQSPERNLGIFALFISFFPLLLAGPIERAKNLIPQFRGDHRFNYNQAAGGLKLIAWGLFKKIAIADRLSLYVDAVYNDPVNHHGSRIIVATVLFAYQVYCDFSAYSDIALGSARLMGIHVMRNFNRPFTATSITDLWRRWHISLSSWFRDYVYTPLSINTRHWGTKGTVMALLISFGLIGLWHAADLKWIVFGLCHGLAMSFMGLTQKFRRRLNSLFPKTFYHLFCGFLTFSFFCFTLIFFRAASFSEALLMISHLVNFEPGSLDIMVPSIGTNFFLISIISLIVLEMTEFFMEKPNGKPDILAGMRKLYDNSRWLRWSSYYALIACTIFVGKFEKKNFIYFDF